MLQTLSRTNQNIAGISEALKVSVLRINQSKLMALLDDPAIGIRLRSALKNIDRTAARANYPAGNLNKVVDEMKGGKGLAVPCWPIRPSLSTCACLWRISASRLRMPKN
ncbi:hypothetical protein [Mucilaginibacter humi]|uniref:hypothetical protein n=1 Tax=Mucilaginibacter humi TaxID=2732510 RepID=UPI001FE94CC9|nr:hypothetical protein [Mucilaginibacter humi]